MIFGFNIARYLRNRYGNMSLIIALAIVPICLCAGGVVDVSMMVSTKSTAQQALDAAALTAATSTATDQPTLLAIANKAYVANTFGRIATQSKLQSLVYDSSKGQITATASGTYSPIFAGVLGYSQMPYLVKTTTLKQAAGTMEVALVLDNTWSMSASLDGTSSKISVLKTAAANLISTIMTTQNAGKVKVAVVPYADYVNVGVGNRSQTWLSVPADYSTTSVQTCVTKTTKSTTSCTGGYLGTCTSSTTNDGITTTTTSSCMIGQTCTTTTTHTTFLQFLYNGFWTQFF